MSDRGTSSEQQPPDREGSRIEFARSSAGNGPGTKKAVCRQPGRPRGTVSPPEGRTQTERTSRADVAFAEARDPAVDWQTAQDYGLFSMAADLIRDHIAHLQDGAPAAVIRLDDHRKTRA